MSQALSGSKDDFLTKTNIALDQLIARYAEHVFKDAPSAVNEQKIGRSWRLLGQGFVTTFVDLMLFVLMMNILPIRFFILLISTPVRMLTGRGSRQGRKTEEINARAELNAPDPQPERWLRSSAASVSEHTTEILEEYGEPRRNKSSEAN